MTIEETETEPVIIHNEEPSVRRRVIGCCAIIIITIFVVALIVGYTPWFSPFFP